jgi:hypothetical protein
MIGSGSVVVQGCGDVVPAGQVSQSNGQVAEGCHRSWGMTCANTRMTFVVGDVPHVVQGFDGTPVTAGQVGELGRAGLVGGQVGDRVYGRQLHFSGPQVTPAALDLDGLHSVGESETAATVDGGDLEAADLSAAMADRSPPVTQGDLAPR